MKKEAKITCIVIIIGVVLFMLCQGVKSVPQPYEGFVSGNCPTTLIKKGNQILLYNPEMAKVPGVNPVVLESLKDYEEYVKWQKASKLDCPILHLEQVFNSQGEAKYEIRNSFLLDAPVGPLNHELPNVNKPPCVQKLIDANKDNSPYNQNMYAAFDPYNQDVGRVTDLDLINEDASLIIKN